jgi:pyrroline-5-carboxylate reductase
MDKNENIRIGLIGTGNMGASILKGIASSGFFKAARINIYDIDADKAKALIDETGTNLMKDNKDLALNSDIIILAVKPFLVKSVLEEIKSCFNGAQKVLASIAAGISIEYIKSILGRQAIVARLMPNLPVMAGEGMTVVCFDNNADEESKALVKKIFECCGKVEELEERLMNEVIALTGSSPAYVAMLIEAMGDAAVRSGIPRNLSYKLAAQAVLGTAKIITETDIHPAKLKDMVCSPAGTTIEAVNALEEGNFRYAVMEAMDRCTKRAREIGSIKAE